MFNFIVIPLDLKIINNFYTNYKPHFVKMPCNSSKASFVDEEDSDTFSEDSLEVSKPKLIPINSSSSIENSSVDSLKDAPSACSQEENLQLGSIQCTHQTIDEDSSSQTVSTTNIEPPEIFVKISEKTETAPNKGESLSKSESKKKTQSLQVPFYNGQVPVGEVRKIKQMCALPKEKEKRIFLEARECRTTKKEKCQAFSRGIIERWRHQVTPIYEHSFLAEQCKKDSTINCDERQKNITRNIGITNNSLKNSLKMSDDSKVDDKIVSKEMPKPIKYIPAAKKKQSYLEQYRTEKYGPIYMKRKPSSDGTECSLFDGSSMSSLSSELKETREDFVSSGSSGDETSFYRKIVSGELNPDEQYDEYFQEKELIPIENRDGTSQSVKNLNEWHQNGTKYVPYTLKDYRTMMQPTTLGKLGPDEEASKEKYQRFKKQREYGDSVSMKNLLKIQLHKKTTVQETGDANRSVGQSCRDSCRKLPPNLSTLEPASQVTSTKMAASAACSSVTTRGDQNAKATVKRKVVINRKKKEEIEKNKSNKALIKMMQDRHFREQEMAEKLRQKDLIQ